MSTSIGFLSKCAIATQTVAPIYKTPIAVASITTAVPLLSESITPEIARVTAPILEGSAGQRADRRGNKSVGGGMEFELDFTNVTTLLTACFGSAAGTVFNFTNSEHAPLSILLEKTVSRFRIIGAKVNSFTISGSAGENFKLSTDWKCYNYDRSSTAFPTSSLSTREPWKFDSMVVLLARNNAAIASTDVIYLTDLSIEVNHNLQDGLYPSQSGSNADLPLEQYKNGFREVKITATAARYESDATATTTDVTELLTYEENDYTLQMRITITGASNSATFLIPNLKLVQIPNVAISGPESPTVPLEFQAFRNNGTNTQTSFTDVSNEMQLTIA